MLELEPVNQNETVLESLPQPIQHFTQQINQPTLRHYEVLKIFRHKEFKPLQWQIISSILMEKRDNVAVLTTGYGKSLCYQYPPVFLNEITVVISPLISLMQDQVLGLKRRNIPACFLGSAQRNPKETEKEIRRNKYRVVYVTAEFATGIGGRVLFRTMKENLRVALIAIDEAHCVSTWGHDFRVSFRELGILKDMFPDVPILAVTATATPDVCEDIAKTLGLRCPQVTISGFNRPNLHFGVIPKTYSIVNDLRKVMIPSGNGYRFDGSTIVYCITQKATEEISHLLNRHFPIKSLPYHAGLKLDVRKDAQNKFIGDEVDVIVATIAFGMGIDKPHIRNVIHYGASSSFENYYQEIGRAGRDNEPAKCIVFWDESDFETHRFLREKSDSPPEILEHKENMANLMRRYLTSKLCRRRIIISYFEKKVPEPYGGVCCDNCDNKRDTCSTNHEDVDFAFCLQPTKKKTYESVTYIDSNYKTKNITYKSVISVVEVTASTADSSSGGTLDNQSISKDGRRSIRDILTCYPLDNARMDKNAESTWRLFREGFSVHEIAIKRGIIKSTVISHLVDAIKMGHPVKMIDLGISDEIQIALFQIIKENDAISWSYGSIKNICPGNITYDQIKVVSSFLKVRHHLSKLNIQYTEFEDVQFEELMGDNSGSASTDSTFEFTDEENLELAAKCEELEQSYCAEQQQGDDNNSEIEEFSCSDLEDVFNEDLPEFVTLQAIEERINLKSLFADMAPPVKKCRLETHD